MNTRACTDFLEVEDLQVFLVDIKAINTTEPRRTIKPFQEPNTPEENELLEEMTKRAGFQRCPKAQLRLERLQSKLAAETKGWL